MKVASLLVAVVVVVSMSVALADQVADKPVKGRDESSKRVDAELPLKKAAPAELPTSKPAAADTGAAGAAADTDADADAGADAAGDPWAEGNTGHLFDQFSPTVGPKLVDLGNAVELDLPADMLLVDATAARQLLEAGGDDATGVVALVAKRDAPWIVVISYDAVGYVSDEEADDLDANELIAAIKTGTLAQNTQRRAKGVPELFVDGWFTPPSYDRANHRLAWGIDAHALGGKVVNDFTRVLGRRGYLAVNLIDAPETLPTSKWDARTILESIRFRMGARYQDHEDDDLDSGMGLNGLILGGAGVAAASKTGILVAILAFLKKGFVLVIAGLAGLYKWLTGRTKKVELRDQPSEPPSSSST